MSDLVAPAESAFPQYCQVSCCSKDGCSVSLCGAPSSRVVIDMDRGVLAKTPGKRCDYLLIGVDDTANYVAPIELKSGGFRGQSVVEQLQGGADIADSRLPPGNDLRFVPALAYGGHVHPLELQRLRGTPVTMRGMKRQVIAIRCGDPIAKALRSA